MAWVPGMYKVTKPVYSVTGALLSGSGRALSKQTNRYTSRPCVLTTESRGLLLIVIKKELSKQVVNEI